MDLGRRVGHLPTTLILFVDGGGLHTPLLTKVVDAPQAEEAGGGFLLLLCPTLIP